MATRSRRAGDRRNLPRRRRRRAGRGRCAAFVSNDSGGMHIAAALGVPLTAMFGPTDERVTAAAGDADVITRDVFCRPCMLRECPIDHRCMKRIEVDAVLQSITSHLT